MSEAATFILLMACNVGVFWLGWNMRADTPPKSGDPCDKCGAPCPSGEGVLWHGERFCTRCYADEFF